MEANWFNIIYAMIILSLCVFLAFHAIKILWMSRPKRPQTMAEVFEAMLVQLNKMRAQEINILKLMQQVQQEHDNEQDRGKRQNFAKLLVEMDRARASLKLMLDGHAKYCKRLQEYLGTIGIKTTTTI